MAALRLSSTTRRGTPGNHSNAARWQRHQVATVWSKTNSTYWWRLYDKRHHERPGAAQAAVVGIEEQPRRAEVDLGLVAGRGLYPDRGARGRRVHPPEEPLHGRVAPGEAVLFDEELEDGLALHALLAPAHHLVVEGATQDCSCAGRSRSGGRSSAASVAGSGRSPVSRP